MCTYTYTYSYIDVYVYIYIRIGIAARSMQGLADQRSGQTGNAWVINNHPLN